MIEIAQTIIAEFAHERTTKNTYRYAAISKTPEAGKVSKTPEISTIYIQKFALGAEPPTRLKVCVEAM